MAARASEKILAAFALQPYLTIPQVARMFYSRRQDGQPAKSRRFSPRPNDTYEVVEGYDSARDILNRMVARKDLAVFRSRGDAETPNRPNLYALAGTRKPIDDRKLYGHDMDVADCFVALRRVFGDRLSRWQTKWLKGEERETFGDRWGLWPDAIFEFEDSDAVFFLEVDRGTMEWDQIVDKLDRYTRFSNAHPSLVFYVLFTAQGYRHDGEDLDRVHRLMPMLEIHRRANQFVAACHDEFLADPAGTVFYSPKDAVFKTVRPVNGRPYKLLEELGPKLSFLAL